MTFCPVCQCDVESVTALHPKLGMVEQCPTCQTPFEQLGGQQLIEPPKNGETHAVLQKVATTRPVAKPAAVDTTDALLERMRARLAEVEREIATRQGFETERDRLRRMLEAAGDVTVSPAN